MSVAFLLSNPASILSLILVGLLALTYFVGRYAGKTAERSRNKRRVPTMFETPGLHDDYYD